MQNHYFVTDHKFNSSRWLKAFPDATLLESVTIPPSINANSVIWIVSQIDHWIELVSFYSQAGCKVIVLTRSEDIDELRAALEAGARGYLNALGNVESLIQASNSVENGAMWLPAILVSRMIGNLSKLLEPKANTDAVLEKLTEREREVTEAILTGATNKEIARSLNITERTVKAHLSSIFSKLGARDRMHLMLLVRGY